MTAPRIISAAVAEELRQVSDTAIEGMTAAGAGERETRAAVLVRDLAASVVALHAEVERAATAERARHFERVRIATWLRTKARLGLAEEWTNKDVLYALLAYADAIDANRMDP